MAGSGTPTPYQALINLITDGEEVKAATPNRPLGQLSQRTQHLKDVLEITSAGQALFVLDAALSSSVNVGDAVYFNSTTGIYEPALAAIEFDPVGGAFILTESSFVIGIVCAKASTTVGAILTFGFLKEFDLSQTIDGDATEAGAYYLSTALPGKLVLQKPPTSVYVLFNRGDNNAHVAPTPREFLENHIHYRFELFAKPAGDFNCVEFGTDEEYVVLNPDSSKAGWLPADDPIFAGSAPSGAKFGYNLSQHQELQRVFPPIPTDNVHLERNGRGLPGEGSIRPTYSVDNNGIWWFENCYANAPWAPELPGCIVVSSSSSSSPSPSSESSSSSSSPSEELPVFDCNVPVEYIPGHGDTRLDEMRLRFYFTKMVFKTSQSVVTSLSPDTDSPITVKDCDGNDATRGELKLGLDLDLQVEEDTLGMRAFKEVEGITLKRGLIVEGVRAGANVSISGVAGEESEFDSGRNLWFGALNLDVVVPGSEQTEGNIDIVALNNVREEIFSDIFFLEMPAGKDSNIRVRVNLPSTGLPTDPKMSFIFRLLARAAGELPDLTNSFRSVPRNAAACTPLALPLADTALTLLAPCAGTPLALNEYIEVETDTFSVVEGDQVFFTLARDSADAFAGSVGILRMGFQIVAGP